MDLFSLFSNQQAGAAQHNFENEDEAGGNNSKWAGEFTWP